MAATKTLLPYYGGKAGPTGAWIAQQLPPHRVYVEPFGGMYGVGMQKRPAPIEVWNDLNDALYNLLTVVREQPDELRRLLQLTPYSRREFMVCFDALHAPHPDPIEWARRVYVALAQSRNGVTSRDRSWSFGGAKYNCSNPDGFINGQDNIPEVAARLRRVTLECGSALDIIRQWDGPDTLLYVDPPYVHSSRNSRAGYAHELDDAAHIELLANLRECKSMVLLSGYRCELYAAELEAYGWLRRDFATVSHSSAARNKGERAQRVESLWLNPAASNAMRTLFCDPA